MLRHFLYLNEPAVNSYIAVIEGGISDETIRRHGKRGTKGGDLGGKAAIIEAKLSGQQEHSEEDELVLRDTVEHRFERLINALEQSPERWLYEEVLDLQDAFARLTTGTFVSIDCEVEVPTMIRMLAEPEQLNGLLNMMDSIGPLAQLMGRPLDGLPSPDQVQALRTFTNFRTDLVIVGEVDDTSPRLAGKLDKQHVREMPEGEVRIVGKVARKWKDGEQHSLIALPGAALLSRAERRRAPASTSTDQAADENTLFGPALTLDIVAIYR
ncbi:DUF6414 family protein [Polymorphospora rubra]|uniref:DUF6414 family protein n=1 Tax=Polymorphospora rubra TaxID=338584 RepID=UPI00340F1BB9